MALHTLSLMLFQKFEKLLSVNITERNILARNVDLMIFYIPNLYKGNDKSPVHPDELFCRKHF
jgi:hypothetical protein